MTNMQRSLNVHSIRLHPTYRGAPARRITGIASRCDYVLVTDNNKPYIYIHRNVCTRYPRHIYLCMGSPFLALRYFAEKILPTIKAKFVLISGSTDTTIPNQTDQRRRNFNKLELSYIDDILNNPYLSHWFCENCDDASHPLMQPIPTGMVFKENYPSAGISIPDSPPLRERPMRVLCAHRVREHSQFELRKRVTQLALNEWSQWCTVLTEEVPEYQFTELLKQHSFVLCVEGGGLDPSPKAWQAILYGAIPIIRETALKEAYKELPVAFVSSWDSCSLSTETLYNWYEHFSQMYEDETFRNSVIFKLGIDYWWNKILEYEDNSIERPISLILKVKQYVNKIIILPLKLFWIKFSKKLDFYILKIKNKYQKK